MAVVVTPGQKRRGYVAVGAGIFIMVVMAGLWIFLASIAPSMTITPEQSAAFFGRMHVGFALIFVCGILGLFNGLSMVRTGRPSAPLTLLTLVIFGSALYVLYGATKILPES